MEIRVSKLEQDLSEMKTDLAVIKSNHATRSDLLEEIGKQTKWLMASMAAIAGVSLALARWLF
ncbi:hypothetical protein [Pantoea phytobeneficialis]|uniref:Hemolysin XhlA n=1 Tax=Pantoea phytobeneficialis TaxID=2052056 RepID=A0AAP9H6E3_9GAMM|nr:hypothetical protein [Pantoea phytobeneficialis]MDO6405043.1 hypothetical protein [Pantoea phytobeneficialis]QGR07575.1 hypothetical protein CTZ24_14585 [Pantoea phytobeneficialis]